MEYPTDFQIRKATTSEILYWVRNLPAPKNDYEKKVFNLISLRHKEIMFNLEKR